jgi:hypothetical protein
VSIVVDARDLEPPEPLPFFHVLERNGYAWKTSDFDDGRFEIRIWDKAKPPAGG